MERTPVRFVSLTSFFALFVALLLVAAVVPPVEAAAGGWTVVRLTDNGVDDTVPSIDGNTMVWQQGKDAAAEIWARNLLTRAVTRITNNAVEDANPDVSPRYMVWERPDGGDSDIFLRVRSTGVVTQISNDADIDHSPRVSEESVAWEHNFPAEEVQLYSIYSGTSVIISTGSGHDLLGEIAGRVVVWQRGTKNAAETMLYDGVSAVTSQLTLDAMPDSMGGTDGRSVVWSHYDGVDNEIVLYDISSGSAVQLTNNAVDDYWPDVSGPWVVWVRDDGANNQIWTKNRSTGVETQLTTNATMKEGLCISGPRVVWYESDGSDYEVYAVAYQTFPDVAPDHANYYAIEILADEQVIGGYRGGYFIPDALVKRAQFAKMIVGTLGIPVNEGMVAPFNDLGADDPSDLYPHEFVAAAAAEGITKGVGGGNFAPWDNISRAQVVTMAMRGVTGWWPVQLALPPQSWPGTLGMFDPEHGLNMRVAEWYGCLEGVVGFGPGWDPWAPATRAEVAQIIWGVRNAIRPYPAVQTGTP